MSVSVHIKKRLDSFLLDISFESRAKRIGILGASGCGKSMTLKSIAGHRRCRMKGKSRPAAECFLTAAPGSI